MSFNGLYQSKHRRAIYIPQVYLGNSLNFRVTVHVAIGNWNIMHMRLQNCLLENPAMRMVEVLMNSIESFRGML